MDTPLLQDCVYETKFGRPDRALDDFRDEHHVSKQMNCQGKQKSSAADEHFIGGGALQTDS